MNGAKAKTKYNRDVPRKGVMDLYNWDARLGWLENHRFSMVEQAGDPKKYPYFSASSAYSDIMRPVLRELNETSGLPTPNAFDLLSPGDRAKALQRGLTRLSKKLLQQPPGKGGGGSGQGEGDEEDDKGQGEDQQGENGDGKPKDGQGQPQKSERKPAQPMKAAPSGQPHENEQVTDDDEEPDSHEFDDDDDEEEDDDDEDERETYSGGGDQTYGTAKNASIFYVIRHLLQKLAEDIDYSEVEDTGVERWDPARVIQARWSPRRLENAKRDHVRIEENIYLILDTSGSVEMYSEEIASMAAGAAGIVHLYTGSEARPEYRVERTTPLRSPREPFSEWRHQTNLTHGKYREPYRTFVRAFNRQWYGTTSYSNSFELAVAWWLHLEQPPKGSRIIFWGDSQGAGIDDPRLLQRLLRDYKVVWLQSMPREDVDYFRRRMNEHNGQPFTREQLLSRDHPSVYTDSILIEAMGIPVLYNVTTPASIRQSLQRIA